MPAQIRVTLLLVTILQFGAVPLLNRQPAAVTPATVRVPILMYHYISANPYWPGDPIRTRLSVLPRQFAAQLA